MTRRDRAAIALALEMIRSDVARVTVPSGADLRRYVDLIGADRLGVTMADVPWYDGTPRLLFRARFALLLRALLRADAGDYGCPWCVRCGMRSAPHHWRSPQCLSCMRRVRGTLTTRIAPLWESAPPHGADRG